MRDFPHTFTLRQLQYLTAVAELGSFRQAAQRCHVAQPSLSAQVAQVEEALGLQLFNREPRKVTLTLAGEAVLARVRHVLEAADALDDEAKRLADPSTATLRLGVIPTIAPYFLPDVAAALRQHFPRMTFVWSEDKTAVLIAKLHEAALDGALVALEAEIGEVEHVVIGTDEFALACHVGHPLSSSETALDLERLEGESVLLLDDGHCLRDQALAFCKPAGMQELAVRATSLSTLVQMTASGLGITLLPLLAAELENRRNDVVVRRFSGTPPRRTLALVWRKQAPLQAVLQRVGETMRATYAQVVQAKGHGSGTERARTKRLRQA